MRRTQPRTRTRPDRDLIEDRESQDVLTLTEKIRHVLYRAGFDKHECAVVHDAEQGFTVLIEKRDAQGTLELMWEEPLAEVQCYMTFAGSVMSTTWEDFIYYDTRAIQQVIDGIKRLYH